MMTQADCLIKAVIACLEARFQEDRGNTERGIPDGFPVPLKMAVDEDREGKEYALFQAAEMEEIAAEEGAFAVTWKMTVPVQF